MSEAALPRNFAGRAASFAELHEREVPLTPHGIVDPQHLLAYLPPSPHLLPLKVAPGMEYHHFAGFPADDFTRLDEYGLRDERIVGVRSSSYSQVLMDEDIESGYHKEMAEHVPLPAPEVADKFKRDERRVDLIGATALAMRRGSYPNSIFRRTMRRSDALERIIFFENTRELAIDDISKIQVMPFITVTSALWRLGQKLNDAGLQKIARANMLPDGVALPLRAPSHKTLWVIANGMHKRYTELSRPELTNEVYAEITEYTPPIYVRTGKKVPVPPIEADALPAAAAA